MFFLFLFLHVYTRLNSRLHRKMKSSLASVQFRVNSQYMAAETVNSEVILWHND